MTCNKESLQTEGVDVELIPVLMVDADSNDDKTSKSGPLNCCRRIFSKEVKAIVHQLFHLSWAVAIAHLCSFLVNTQSVLFCGRLGATELAAGSLCNTITMIFGVSIAIGISSAVDTLSAQAFGAKNFRMVGSVLQRGILISAITGIAVAAMWMLVKHFLLLIRFEAHIAEMADMFMMIMLPMIPAEFLYQILVKYLHTQGIVRPIVLIGLFVNAAAFGLNYILIFSLEQGFRGVAIAQMLVSYVKMLSIVGYILIKKVHKKTWFGWSSDSLHGWKQYLSLSVPGLMMICMEWWTFEIGMFVLGKFGENTVAAHGVLLQITILAFLLPFSVSVSASILVGNFLGANDARQAKLTVKISVVMAVCGTAVVSLVIGTCREYIAKAFSNDLNVVNLILDLIPFMTVFVFEDAMQGVCAGIVRGCGRQKIGMIINFICHDIIALPLGISLAYVMNLQLKGFWWGIGTGMFVQLILYSLAIGCTNWKRQAELAIKRTSKGEKQQANECSVAREQLLVDCELELKEIKDESNEDGKEQQSNGKCNENLVEQQNKDHCNVVENNSTADGKLSSQKTITKRLILLRSIPFFIAILILFLAICIRFYVPLPTAHIKSQSGQNQTVAINATTAT